MKAKEKRNVKLEGHKELGEDGVDVMACEKMKMIVDEKMALRKGNDLVVLVTGTNT